ncbi:glycine cleavage system aminomethyltransferase GcvT [Catelliglobosispora koreensis]|uniref:glycine cleavage system aminomethyltransferase GcvT n=1 Tax=Catelliglobosispora koreensis TaxID=129052 RepID=UPI00037F4864|nr:glycine cleavage system aminomethyltransferase GcvT [Catelliglobosispora koreensis]
MQQTPLHGVHACLDAKFTPFGGWNMPLRYTSELAEHHAVRRSAGLFDLSHMGQIDVAGPDAAQALDFALTSHISALGIGAAKYTMICAEGGGILDDLVVYRLGADWFLVVANAANTGSVVQALQERGAPAVLATDRAMIAVQGPDAESILARFTPTGSLRYYAGRAATIAGRQVMLARTGYTGEDGFEIYCGASDAVALWELMSAAGATPAGLACRDTLRLEAGMPLYGNELHLGITPFDAGLGRVVAFGKPGGFVGQAALAEQSVRGPQHVLAGLTGQAKRSARQGYVVTDPLSGETIGTVTSGAPSPTLGRPIALAYLRTGYSTGSETAVDIRGTAEPFTVTSPRFYTRSR